MSARAPTPLIGGLRSACGTSWWARTVGRTTGEVELAVVGVTNRPTLAARITATTSPTAIVNTDEWAGYAGITASGRIHRTVHHHRQPREWARDDDGVREVRCNTMEGIWVGLRNYLRPFRGVSKWFLAGYVALYNALSVGPALRARVLRASSPEATRAC